MPKAEDLEKAPAKLFVDEFRPNSSEAPATVSIDLVSDPPLGVSGLTHRTDRHVVADQAVLAVRTMFTGLGHATGPVDPDYGEDLLVQTRLDGKMDDSRIWVQVKGTTADCRRRLPTIRVHPDTAERWRGSADMVIVVLWNVETGDAWYHLPRQSQSLNGSVRFRRQDRFDAESAECLVWLSRIEHASRTILRNSALMARGRPSAECQQLRDTFHVLSILFAMKLLRDLIHLGLCELREGEDSAGLAAVGGFVAAAIEIFRLFDAPNAEARGLLLDDTPAIHAKTGSLVETFGDVLQESGRGLEGLVLQVAGDLAAATASRKITISLPVLWSVEVSLVVLVATCRRAASLAVQQIDSRLVERGVDVTLLPPL